MRLKFVRQSVFLLLLSSVFSCAAQALNLAGDSARMSSSGLLSQFSSAFIARPSAMLFRSENSLGVPFLINNIHFDVGSVATGGIVAAGQPSSVSVLDGLLVPLSADYLKALPGESMVLAGASLPSVSALTAVPLSVTLWLFSAALLGFVVVANRRKL